MKVLLSTFIFSFFSLNILGQIVVTPAQNSKDIELLVRKFVGRGVLVGNITHSGFTPSMGSFSNQNPAIGLSDGIIITNGLAKNAEGPNDQQLKGFNNSITGDNTDFNNVVSNSLFYNISYIEFDFFPTIDTISFSTIYGSEEYSAQVEIVSDPFIAMLSGPSIVNKVNIATLPGIAYIGATTINNGTENNFLIPPSGPCKNCDKFVYNPVNSNITQYNGFTKKLTFKYGVNACNWYRLKLAIADQVGNLEDSGILLGEGNFGKFEIATPTQTQILEYCSNVPLPRIHIDSTKFIQNEWFYNGNKFADNLYSLQLINEGTYIVNTTISGNCSLSDSVVLKIGDYYTFEINKPTDKICTNDSITIQGQTSRIIDPNYFQWNIGTTLGIDSTQTIKIVPTTESIVLKVNDPEGCKRDTSWTLSVNDILFKSNIVNTDTQICKGDNIVINTQTQERKINQSAQLNYHWYQNSTLISGFNNQTQINLLPNQNQKIRLEVSNQDCIVTDSIFIQLNEANTTVTGSIAGCNQDKITLDWEDNLSVSWSNYNPTTLPGNRFSFTINQNDTINYTIIDKDNGCSKDLYLILNQWDSPIYTIYSDTLVCKNDIATVQIVSSNAKWNINNTTLTQLNIAQDTTLEIVIKTIQNCEANKNIQIKAESPPVLSIVGPAYVCDNSSQINLTASGSLSYNWLTKNNFQSIASLPWRVGETLSLAGKNIVCTATTTFTPNIRPSPTLPLISTTGKYFCKEETFYPTLTAPSNLQLRWLPYNVTFNGLRINETVTVTLLGTNLDGCTSKDTIYISKLCPNDTLPPVITPVDSTLLLPNTITPNGDGYNDYLNLGIFSSKTTSLTIYNRFGTLVYKSENYQNNWPQNPIENGLYYYSVLIDNKQYKTWLLVTE